jgi:hypothetical protein
MPLPCRSSFGGLVVTIIAVVSASRVDASASLQDGLAPVVVPRGTAAAAPAAATGTAPARPGTPGPTKIKIDVRGPLALVEIDRPLRLGREYGARAADEVVLDLALPAGARLARAELRGPNGGPPLRLRPGPAGSASASYLQVVQTQAWRPAKVAPQADEGADLRLAVAASGLSSGGDPEAMRVRARFVAPLVCRGGDLVLTFPASLDPTPPAAQVQVQAELGPSAPALARIEVGGVGFARPGGAVRTTVSTDRPWQIVIGPARVGGAEAGTILYAAAAGGAVAANLCRGPASAGTAAPKAAAAAAPGRVLFLIDRSRSMGPGGADSAGALARALALALPPGANFAAVLFDREAEALFPVFRAPTMEALAGLESAIQAGSLRNGSDLLTALRRGEQLLARADGPAGSDGAGKATAGDPLLVVITDGALPDDHDRAAITKAMQGRGLARARSAVLILRAPAEEPPSAAALRTLAALPGHRGGLLRQIDPVGAAALAPELTAALAAGGDIVELAAPAGLGPGHFSQNAIGPGQGALWVGRSPGPVPSEVTVRGSRAGRTRGWQGAVVSVEAPWASAVAALSTPPGAQPSFTAVAPAGDRAVLLTPPPSDVVQTTAQRGQLDRDVVHKALAYAYLPRARACYLTRAVKTAADFRLRGRLRLELHLERGEMVEAVVARSSLGRADIERCLREAAFQVDVPRPVLADVPAIAALNLVFRPRTEGASRDAGALPGDLDRNIDRLLGPRAPATDPLELLIEDDARPPTGRISPTSTTGAGRGPAVGRAP